MRSMVGDVAIRVEGLVKRYGAVTALDGVGFEVRRGELFGLIGPDGAGKTTLFRLLATLLTPDAGRAEVDGYDIVREVRAIRLRVGYMPGRFSLYADLSVEENLAFFAALFGVSVRDNYGLIEPIYRHTRCRKAIRRYEAETGPLLCVDSPSVGAAAGRAYDGGRSRFAQRVLGDAGPVAERGDLDPRGDALHG